MDYVDNWQFDIHVYEYEKWSHAAINMVLKGAQTLFIQCGSHLTTSVIKPSNHADMLHRKQPKILPKISL